MKIFDKTTDKLIDALLTLKDKKEFECFLIDAFTVKEIKAIAQRFEVAEMLYDKASYNDIEEKTGASTATISRVNKCLNYGEGGYETVLNRLKENK